MLSASEQARCASCAQQLQAVLAPLADAQRAVPMQAYMKHHFAFLGIATPARRAASTPLIRSLKGESAAFLLALAQRLWEMPQREYQHAAIDMLARWHKQFRSDDVPALLQLAQQKSWWDSVDGLAGVVNEVVLRLRVQGAQQQMDACLLHDDFWLRRIAMIHQLGWRERTDTDRLARYALHLAHEPEFFIRKAIGWGLRDYAWHNPDWVRALLKSNQQHLSPLSIREAGKHL